VNGLDGELRLKPGTVVYIPRFGGSSSGKVIVADTAAAEAGKTKPARNQKGVKTAKQAGTTEKKSVHVVKKGETLASISEKYGMDIDSIRAENNLKSDKVYPNMKLRLASFVEKIEKPARKPAKKTGKTKVHVVKKGETLSSISGKYGIDVSSLREDNNLRSDKVYPRMKLRIPVDAG
jgi:LysM repeat protein